ncbi:MAG: hypothetical protein AAGI45_07625 [Cyanobacteria bacterium P01_H01_bin.26]
MLESYQRDAISSLFDLSALYQPVPETGTPLPLGLNCPLLDAIGYLNDHTPGQPMAPSGTALWVMLVKKRW